MIERRNSPSEPPPPCGAGAGGGGPTEQDTGVRHERSIGWAPKPGKDRQKDHARTNARAKRLRREMTSSEKELWRLLREEPGRHFRKQVAVDDIVFDFGEFGARLLIELDGPIHELADVAEWDGKKEAHARAAGFKV